LEVIANIARVQNYMVAKDVKAKLKWTGYSIENTLRLLHASAGDPQSSQDIQDAFKVFKIAFPTDAHLARHHGEFLRELVETGSAQASGRIVQLAQTLNASVGLSTSTYGTALLAHMTALAESSGVPSGLRRTDL
jgi:hypothetical protein